VITHPRSSIAGLTGVSIFFSRDSTNSGVWPQHLTKPLHPKSMRHWLSGFQWPWIEC